MVKTRVEVQPAFLRAHIVARDLTAKHLKEMNDAKARQTAQGQKRLQELEHRQKVEAQEALKKIALRHEEELRCERMRLRFEASQQIATEVRRIANIIFEARTGKKFSGGGDDEIWTYACHTAALVSKGSKDEEIEFLRAQQMRILQESGELDDVVRRGEHVMRIVAPPAFPGRPLDDHDFDQDELLDSEQDFNITDLECREKLE